MIAFLSGTPRITTSTTAIICGGVGYDVRLTPTTRNACVNKSNVELFIYTHVKEDAIELYGFFSEDEKLLFFKLIGVDGVGPKTALSIMNQGVAAILSAVRSADTSFFQAIPRVGKKSAQKIIIELKGKLGGEELSLVEPVGKAKEAIEALSALGFSQSESQKVVESMQIADMRLEDVVKTSIKHLTKQS